MSLGRFQGRRPFVRSTIARWQEATDPQFPKGGSQRGLPNTEGAHPTASGRRKEVVLFRQSYPALTNGGVDNAALEVNLSTAWGATKKWSLKEVRVRKELPTI